MILNKQSIIYLILTIFSVYCTGILASDCDVYKEIIGNHFIYKEDLDKVNGNCCRLDYKVGCDDQNNIISVNFSFIPDCGIASLFEQLAKLPKLQKIEIDMDDVAIPSTVGKVTQIKKLKLKYPFFIKNKSIPDEIGNLINLEELDLSESNLVGKIPNTFGNLVNLKKLDLNSNHLEGYVPYEFKYLKNLKDLNLSGNVLEGFVPPISSLSSCSIQYNEKMCYLKSSRCRSELKECTLDQIKTTNNNNNNPKPDSGEFENEKEITQITNSDGNNDNYFDSKFDSDSYEDRNELTDGYYSTKKKGNFLKPFLIVISSGVVIIAIIFFAIYKTGKKTPKFNKFDDDNNNNNYNDINTNNNAPYTQPLTYNYNYGPSTTPMPSSPTAPTTPISPTVPTAPTAPTVPTAPTTPVYYPVPSPVPPAAQPYGYIPPSPATPYAIPTQPPQVSTYVPRQPNMPFPNSASPNDTLPRYETIDRSQKGTNFDLKSDKLNYK